MAEKKSIISKIVELERDIAFYNQKLKHFKAKKSNVEKKLAKLKERMM